MNIKKLDKKIIDQIAAGEIIQRPSFALKELLENSIDAKAENINIKIQGAGKKLIQILDDGIGMNNEDCTKCFDKHATSKVNKIEDLWNIKTLGFRGEALYAISTVSKVDIISKNKTNKLGTRVLNEAGKIKLNEKCNCNPGTLIKVKNLFYNTPARRKFLKSDLIENRHIINTFLNIALAHENINFQLEVEGKQLFNIKKQNKRQRITGLIRKNINEHIIPITEKTNIIEINGFIGKPEFAKKNKNEQYIFLNKRCIKNNHINKSIIKAYEGLIKDSNPAYFIFLNADTSKIDVNIHPTKNEVKFENEIAINKIIHAAVKKSLGQYNISPSFNFEQELAFNINSSTTKTLSILSSMNRKEKLIKNFENSRSVKNQYNPETNNLKFKNENLNQSQQKIFQIQNKFILIINNEEIIIIHQSRAHQRILYDHFKYNTHEIKSQKILYPKIIDLNHEEFIIISQIKKELESLGFNILILNDNKIEINGIPNDNREYNINFIIETLIQSFKDTGIKNINIKNQISNLLAKQMCIKNGQNLQAEEVSIIVEEIFNCKSNMLTPDGKKIMIKLNINKINQGF